MAYHVIYGYGMWQSHVFGFFRLVYRIEVAGLPCRNHRFIVSKSPVCRVEIATGLLCQSRRFTVSKWPSHRFAVSESPVYRVKIAAGLRCRSCRVTGLPCRSHRRKRNKV